MRSKFRHNKPINEEGEAILHNALDYCDAMGNQARILRKIDIADAYTYAGNILYHLIVGGEKDNDGV